MKLVRWLRRIALLVAISTIHCGSDSDSDTPSQPSDAASEGTNDSADAADVAEDGAERHVDDAGDKATDSSPPVADALPDLDATTPDASTPDAPTGDEQDAPWPDAASDRIAPDGPSSSRHTARPLGTTTANRGYYEYVPPGYGDGAKRPLLVFWHGVGENGNGTTELGRVLTHGPPKLIAADQWPADRPFVVLSPQHVPTGVITAVAGTGGGYDCPTADEIHAFMVFALENYDIDPGRVYLTGLSCGAIGSWNYLGKFLGQQVVAAVLVAGDGRPAWTNEMCALGQVAIWGFHGDADTTVPPAGTTVPMQGLAACPMSARQEEKMTIYPGVGHDSWTRTYDLTAGNDVYTWLLGFRR